MSMSLTDQDLTAIQDIVKKIVDDRADQSEILMGEGFAEVYKHIGKTNHKLSMLHLEVGSMQQALGRVESLQQTEISRLDNLHTDFVSIRKSLMPPKARHGTL